MGSGMFKVGDEVIGYDKVPMPISSHYDGRVCVITALEKGGKGEKPWCEVQYSDRRGSWAYNIDEIVLAKPLIINTILNEI